MPLTLELITVPTPTMPAPPEAVPWPRPEPTLTGAADLFLLHDLKPNPRRYLEEDLPAPCACLVSVCLVDAAGSIAAARAIIEDARSVDRVNANRLALVRATGWSMPFIIGLDLGFTFGFLSKDQETSSRHFHDPDFHRGAALGVAARQVLRDRGMLR